MVIQKVHSISQATQHELGPLQMKSDNLDGAGEEQR